MTRDLGHSASGNDRDPTPHFLVGGGEMGALIRAHDWSQSSVGPPIAMPGLGGLELARLVRAEAWGGPVLMIAVSGWGQAVDKARSREAGFDHHLVKPVEFAALDVLLREPAG